MAIDRIPGVGPTNADIATAVAAPSAASIAAAVAAPSAATIASAVAAPSLASITSAIQSNAGSPYGGTYTQIYSGTSINSFVTVSGLGSYKYLKIVFFTYNVYSSNFNFNVRFNNDSGNNYINNVTHFPNENTVRSLSNYASQIRMAPHDSQNAINCQGIININNNNSTVGFKEITYSGGYNNGNSISINFEGKTAYLSSSAISTFNIVAMGPDVNNNVTIWGAN